MRIKTFIKFAKVTETQLIKFKKKYKRKTNIQINKYFKYLFTSIFKIIMKYLFLYTKVIICYFIKITQSANIKLVIMEFEHRSFIF